MKKKTSHDSKAEYLEALKKANEDTNTVIKTVEEMIDLPFYDYCQFLEGKNVGELKAFRSLLQTNLDRADVYGKTLVENKVNTFGKEDRITLGSVFAITARIQDRMGYIDFLVKKLSLN
jgi:hypothetical protein